MLQTLGSPCKMLYMDGGCSVLKYKQDISFIFKVFQGVQPKNSSNFQRMHFMSKTSTKVADHDKTLIWCQARIRERFFRIPASRTKCCVLNKYCHTRPFPDSISHKYKQSWQVQRVGCLVTEPRSLISPL